MSASSECDWRHLVFTVTPITCHATLVLVLSQPRINHDLTLIDVRSFAKAPSALCTPSAAPSCTLSFVAGKIRPASIEALETMVRSWDHQNWIDGTVVVWL